MEVFEAVQAGDLAKVRSLVEKGVDKDGTDLNGHTALCVAVRSGHLEIVQCLVEQGARIDGTSCGGWTPLHAAAALGGPFLDVVEYLLDQGADRDRTNDVKDTPLHHAASYGNLKVVQCLLAYGADINVKNLWGQTPFDRAGSGKIKQAIRDAEQQRYAANFGKKRIPEADLRPPAPPSKETKDGEGDEEEEEEEEDESSGDDDEDEEN